MTKSLSFFVVFIELKENYTVLLKNVHYLLQIFFLHNMIQVADMNIHIDDMTLHHCKRVKGIPFLSVLEAHSSSTTGYEIYYSCIISHLCFFPADMTCCSF